jgi:hypothetical protein
MERNMVAQSIIDEIQREEGRMRRKGFWLAEHIPPVSVGTGLTQQKRPPLPEEVPQRCSRVRRALEEYWRAKWPTDPDGERYQLGAAINWARSNTGPKFQTPQHPHWYAQGILRLASLLSPEVDRTVEGHAEHVMLEAVEAAYKIGVLFSEVTWKLEHERAAVSSYNLQKKRLIGSAGGGATTKRDAARKREIFAQLALESVHSWAGFSRKQRIVFLKKLARHHDQTADPKIFHRKGELLSDRWFAERISDLEGTGDIIAALKRP